VSIFSRYSESELLKSGAYNTSKEISGQPELWMDFWKTSERIIPTLKKFLLNVFKNPDVSIVLTGAGTSAFIGNVLAEIIEKETGIYTKPIESTDIVTHPELYFHKNKTLLIISFARSGNSPESAQVIELSEQLSKKIYHLIITCNRNSKLVSTVKEKDSFIFYMPPQANDQSLAMTGSFTVMLLAGLLIAYINKVKRLEENINRICKYGRTILTEYSDQLRIVAELEFDRAIFLGSGALKGVARESHLKLQELTDGQVICKYDSFLGLRHGPKAVINEKTLIVSLFSNNEYVNKYEFDLINAFKTGRKNLFSIGIMENKLNIGQDLQIIFSSDQLKVDECFLSVVSVLPAQMLGFFKSLNLGLKPDSPSNMGMIHRVVQGVNIYPYNYK